MAVLASQDVKGAGTLADEVAVASLAALMHTKPNNFFDLAACWCGCLLFRECVFRRTRDGSVFVSLGFQKWAGFGWRVREIQSDDTIYYETPAGQALQDSRECLEFLHCTNLASRDELAVVEQFEAIPCKICNLATSVRGMWGSPHCALRVDEGIPACMHSCGRVGRCKPV